MHASHEGPSGATPRRVLALGFALLLLAAVSAAAAASPHPDPGSAAGLSVIVSPARHAPTSVAPPRDLSDLPSWLDYRARHHLVSLPLEARVFYRRGLLLGRSGAHDEAVRLVRGAAELDPGFVAPHLTLASWLLLREPSQALLQYATVIDLGRQSFLLQLALLGNTVAVALQSLFLALLAAGLIVLALRNRELRHACSERLARFTGPVTARRWAWALLLLPFVTGFGLALPTVLLLGLLWPVLRAAERAVFVGLLAVLLAAPWAVGFLDHLGVPLREGQPPFHGVALLPTDPPTADRRQELAAAMGRDPANPFLPFAAAWTARHDGNLSAAEAGYRRALELRPDDDRALNNLGNVLAMEGHTDEALDAYRRAAELNRSNAAAAFNASQIYTQRYDYHAATEALSRASALNFDLVKTYQSLASDDGVLPLVDQWIAPKSFWAALSAERIVSGGRAALPPAWRGAVETSGWGIGAAALLAALLGLFAGARAQRGVPLRTCSNCGAVICRRCACRRRENALCPSCAAAEARAETPDFGRVLLAQRRGEVRLLHRRVRMAVALLLPGYGLLAFRRVLSGVLLLAATAALVAATTGYGAPFTYETRLALPVQEIPLAVIAGAWVFLYAISILGYLGNLARADAAEAAQAAPVRSRIRVARRDHSALAA